VGGGEGAIIATGKVISGGSLYNTTASGNTLLFLLQMTKATTGKNIYFFYSW